MTAAAICGIVFGTLLGIIAGILIGFYLTKKYYDKQLRDNPPITKEQIRTMFEQMGRKASEKQVNSIMNNMKNPSRNKK